MPAAFFPVRSCDISGADRGCKHPDARPRGTDTPAMDKNNPLKTTT
jgi:hypothetical protein